MFAARFPGKSQKKQWFLLLLALFLLALLALDDIRRERLEHDRAERVHLANLADVSVHILSRQFLTTDQLIESIREDAGELLTHPQQARLYSAALQRRVRLVAGADIVLLLDAAGQTLASNREELIGQDFAHRYYFQEAARQKAEVGVVSPAFVSVFGNRTFTLSKAVRDAHGQLLGVIMATLDATRFGELLDAVRYEPDMAASLVHANGQVILSTPTDSAKLARPFVLPGGISGRGGLFELPAGDDEGARIVAWRNLLPAGMTLNAPLIVAVERDYDAVLQPWRDYVRNSLGICGLLVAILTAGLYFYQRHYRERWAAERRQEAILQVASDGFAVIRKTGQIVDANPAFMKMLGLAAGDLAQLSIGDIDVCHARGAAVDALSAVAASGTDMLLETVYLHRSGRQVEVEVACRAFQADGEHLLFIALRDVGRRRESERSLQRIGRLVDSSADMLLLLDSEQRIVLASPSFSRCFSLPDVLVGRTLLELLGGAIYRQVGPYLDCALAGESVRFSLLCSLPDGSQIHLSAMCTPYRERGDWNGIALAMHDVTSLEQAKSALLRERDLAQLYLDTMQTLMVAIDTDWRITMINPAACAAFGRSRGDLLGEDWFDERLTGVSGQTLIPRFIQLLTAESGAIDHLEYPVCNAVGMRRMLAWQTVCLRDRDGGTLGILMAGQDVTEMRAAEAELNTLSSAVEQSHEGIMLTDTAGRIEYVNAAFVETSGYTREELIGQTPRILHSGETPEAVFEGLWAALLGGRAWRGEIVNRRKDGRLYCENELISPIRNAAGEVTHFLAVKRDVTEQKAIENELARHRDQLESLVGERTEALKLANAEIRSLNASLEARALSAESANQAKSLFLANMSHEIRTPLNAILGMTQIMMLGKDALAIHGRLRHIWNAGKHLLGLINDILDFSKIEADKLVLEWAPLTLADLLDEIRFLFVDRAREKSLDWQVSSSAEPELTVLGDWMRIRQVLVNFVSNAFKFTDAGHVRLQVRELGRASGRVVLYFEIEDTGVGIAEEAQSRLFQVFEQADGSTTRKYGGTGLGLAISKKLVERMGGKLGMSSVPAKGSRFWFELTLDVAAATGETPRSALPVWHEGDATGLRGRVLVVEDDLINQEIFAEIFTSTSLSFDLAGNGQEALERVATAPRYDLIVMDMQMPVMDGLQATREIRKQAAYRDVPIIAITANAFVEDREKCMQAGMNDYLSKPILLEPFMQMLAKWLGGVHVSGSDGVPHAHAQLAFLQGVEGLDVNHGLQAVAQRESSYLRILGKFFTVHADAAAQMTAYLAQGETTKLGRLAHAIKGSAATLGALRLAEVAGLVEQGVHDAVSEIDLGKRVAHFCQVHARFVEQLKALYGDESAALASAEKPGVQES